MYVRPHVETSTEEIFMRQELKTSGKRRFCPFFKNAHSPPKHPYYLPTHVHACILKTKAIHGYNEKSYIDDFPCN
jgi:hypothetical protein